MADLPPRQQEVLDFITHFINERGYPPTLREISHQLGMSGTVGALKHLAALERKGYIRKTAGSSRGIVLSRSSASLALPIVGTVRAGLPQPAIEEIEGYCAVDATWVRGEGCFFLRVKGDSMIDAHILDGDLALIRPQQTAENGDIVVAMLDGEATLKRFYREKGRIRLQPENRHMAPIVVRAGAADTVIIGTLLRTIRSHE